MVGLGPVMVREAVTAIELELVAAALGPPALMAITLQVTVSPASAAIRLRVSVADAAPNELAPLKNSKVNEVGLLVQSPATELHVNVLPTRPVPEMVGRVLLVGSGGIEIEFELPTSPRGPPLLVAITEQLMV